jgi:DNA polymerase type B, organellar and viral
MSERILTMDLETREIEGSFHPYCVSIFDGNEIKSFYLLDFNDCESMLKESIEYIMKQKYHKHIVYLHNFSYFDSVFLINILSDLSDKIVPIIRDGKIIDFKFYYKNNYYLNFRDSYLLLPLSLSKLSKTFKLDNKGVFPHKFVNNKNISLDYEGKFPRIKFFDMKKISLEEYKNYKNLFNKNKKWNLREESIKYCELDSIILYKVLIEFNKIIFSKFRVDIFKYPTISSLAFAIYRSNYLKSKEIPIIDGKMYNDLKLSYTGGTCDVYKPFGANIKVYDVNSLYPTVMYNYEMPVGKPIYFEGDISKIEKDPFGFFEVEINAPLDLNIPLLQVRIKTENGERTVAPVGT